MSSTNSTTSVPTPHKPSNLNSRKPEKSSKPKKLSPKQKLLHKPTTPSLKVHPHPHPPPSTCGPLTFENEFVQFYSELYKSAILFSDPNYQQMLLFSQKSAKFVPPTQPLGHLFLHIPPKLSPTWTPTPSKTRTVKKAQRRLSGGSTPKLGPKPSTTSSDYNSAESGGGSLSKKTFSEHFLLSATTSGFPATSTPTKHCLGNGKVPKLKRRVSFSKNSPRSRSRSNSNSNPVGDGSRRDPAVPWITIQENYWSSDMDETDTTETEEDNDNATSTLGEGEEGFIFAKSETGTWDGDNEHSTTDDGNHSHVEEKVAKIGGCSDAEMQQDIETRFRKLSTTKETEGSGEKNGGKATEEAHEGIADMPESEA